eukprot:CAMPEP_0182879346 /NCGR_PEP_ID=MMETSP0034_2-20130328/15919_1 /TAXON_ID=156128 /ORGANISM="Nephroselmis pyriformis, Strain CCMP717" /LENGTH=69 /DNA_ID=CAMNT_0025012279 /DNA_START=275 /DNA_END=481 /DNA_ORIENTATION=+
MSPGEGEGERAEDLLADPTPPDWRGVLSGVALAPRAFPPVLSRAAFLPPELGGFPRFDDPCRLSAAPFD